jgi:D-beta-D-heptose 7-phosphate kinase/D-beta-D-heptose 1-phosphate adenosyltransferase
MQELLDMVAGFSEKQVLLIGDTILDIFVYGMAIGKSAETPTIVAREIETKWSLGGAFLVARNILELGARVDFVTLVGDDEEAAYVRGFTHPNFRGILISDPGRRTTVKKRYWVDGYKLLQFDTLDNRYIGEKVVQEVMAVIQKRIHQYDAVVVSDNRHGFLSDAFIDNLVKLSTDSRKFLYVDSQLSQASANHTRYRGATLISLNRKEALSIDPSYQVSDESSSFDSLRRILGIENIVIKLGGEGAVALIRDRIWRSEVLGVEVIDTCGAGDAFLAALCLSGLEKPDLILRLANNWAGLSTSIHGTEPPRKTSLLELLAKAS